MIIGFPKRTLLALPRALGRVVGTQKPAAAPVRTKSNNVGPFAAFEQLMERHVDLMIRQLGE